MGKFDYAKCPNCGKIAYNRSEVDVKFGVRNCNGNIRVQSWCRECR